MNDESEKIIWHRGEKIKLTDQQFERLWSKIKNEGIDDCWNWLGKSVKKNGYGRLAVCFDGRILNISAHRIVWMLAHGQIPTNMPYVLHTCDNPKCCNIRHLFIGTFQDNMDDRDQKCRQASGDRSGARTHPESIPKGEDRWNSKLSGAKVVEIRKIYSLGKTSERALARRFGVSRGAISSIIACKTWTHI